MAKRKDQTWTSLVFEVLKTSDDFMDYAMLQRATGGNYNQVSAACFHLRKCNAIGVEITPDGKGWWFATPEEDNRSKHIDERCKESRPRRRRKGGKPWPTC